MFFKPELEEDDDAMEAIAKTNALKLLQEQPNGSYVAEVGNPVM